MPLKMQTSGKIEGQSKEFTQYEKDIQSGKIPCPFTARFTEGKLVVAEQPVPLAPNGDPKIHLFSKDPKKQVFEDVNYAERLRNRRR